MPTVVYTVAASHDDTYFNIEEGLCYNEADTILIEKFGVSVPGLGGVRFVGFIPSGAQHIVTAAHLRLRAHSDGNLTIRITGHDADNTPDYTVPNCSPARTETDALVDWATGALVGNTWYESDDIAAIVQEIIGRPGWVSGNAIGFKLLSTGNDSMAFYSYDHLVVGSSAPELHITYSDRYQGGMML